MKNKNITDEEYNICINAWKDNNMKTFKDFLEWYNNLDVLPFIEAVEKMKDFYKLKRLDIFKDGVSLPGLVLKYLMKSTDSDFYLFDEEDKITKDDRKRNNLFYLLKDSIVGGPSIIFTSGGRPVHTACTLRTLCTLFKTGNTTEKQTSGFQSRKGGDGIRTIKLREIRRESVKLG
jgi:chromosomal replication initiation ATPase DnaA